MVGGMYLGTSSLAAARTRNAAMQLLRVQPVILAASHSSGLRPQSKQWTRRHLTRTSKTDFST